MAFPYQKEHSDDHVASEPPTKRRRFFADADELSSDPVSHLQSPLPPRQFFKDEDDIEEENEYKSALNEIHDDELPEPSPARPPALKQESSASFDQVTFEAFIGDKVSANILSTIKDHCGNDLERAVNMYFDGTYKKFMKKPSWKTPLRPASTASSSRSPSAPNDRKPSVKLSKRMPSERYLGAFGVEGWATRSGTNVLKHGDKVKIERQKPQPTRGKGKSGPITPSRGFAAAASRRVDVIVRFTTQNGTEVGRLAKETASWVSALIDEKICRFEGTVVYAPERLRTNDTIFLQLRCSLLDSAFFIRSFQLADDRSAAFFEQNETNDEKTLRMRQVALVKLFQEINLQPTMTNSSAKDSRKGLLQAAEQDEQKQKEAKKTNGNINGNGKETGSSQSSDNEEGEELEQDHLDALYKKAQSFDFSTPEVEPAGTFAMTLRSYQKQALHWMMAKEKDEKSNREPSMHPLWEEYDWPLKDVDDIDVPQVEGQSKFYVNPYSGDLSLDFPVQEQHCLGGILADEMGLGKTIQMLSLVHTHRSEIALQARQTAVELSSVNQLTRLGKNSESVLDAPCTTLVVAPMSLLSQWQSEAVKASKDGTMKIELYYGNEKSNNLQALCCANATNAPDLVITSYGVVLSEFSSIAARNGDKSFHHGLFSLKFFRIIIDEAHHIKNRSSKTAKACYEISASHRWALTGTPIVNKLEDLFSLVRFLGVEPWNNFSFWRTFITIPFESGDFMRALDVVQTVLEPLVLRRTKDMKTPDGQPLVLLPPKQIEIVNVELSETERDVYNYIFNKAKRTFSRNVEAGTVMKAFTTIFAQILRLRQSCCHPILVRNRDIVADEEEAGAAADAAAGLADDMDLESLITSFTAVTDEASKENNQTFGAHALEQIRDEAENECPLCFEEPMNDQTVTGCWHSACKKCLLDYIKHQTDKSEVPRCFSCREPINKRDLFEVIRHEDDPDMMSKKPKISLQRVGVNASSAKVSALMSELRSLRREYPKMKSVVFSQFTSFLSLIEPALCRANIKFLRLDGSMAQKARAAVLNEFTERKGFTILLLSLRAGGVGLNLTSAGRVFMMDPWWSFSVEAQAIDRVHRMGQESEVQVKRFVVKESVEERMLKVQERKKFMSGEEVERQSNNVAAAHDSISHQDPEIKQEDQDDLEITQVPEVEGVEDNTKSVTKDKFEDPDEFDSDDEHHLCSLLLYFISKTLLNHIINEPEDTPMDRFAEQFLGRQDPSSRPRLPQEPSFMETFAKNLAKSAAKSAARRAMGQSSSENRTRDGTRSGGNQINPEDFRGVAEFVLGMLGSKNEQHRREDDRKRDKKRKRDREKERDREAPRSRDVEDDGDKYGSDKERRKRRRHRVTFAEPYDDSPRQEERREERYYPKPYDRRDEDKEERRRRRRQRRYKRDLDLKTLKTELEAMSSTIISLNARGAKHRDCEFYDRFVRKGGRLQDVIGSIIFIAPLTDIVQSAILLQLSRMSLKVSSLSFKKILTTEFITTQTVDIRDFTIVMIIILLMVWLLGSLSLYSKYPAPGLNTDINFSRRMRWMRHSFTENSTGFTSLGSGSIGDIGGVVLRLLDIAP
ncbi:DNA repair protein RAD5 [Fusarium austroafricanum]|uniref:DNA repair protein RAD5 n=1 Tax=Fusarium austroafricanum TaxID=2364996 RepID=A0A8H4P272_9HYPO|nr:DNA repair protein RAD5 [Fusarium austroafricanum]